MYLTFDTGRYKLCNLKESKFDGLINVIFCLCINPIIIVIGRNINLAY